MKVIVSGLSKTGTKTMATALRKLGYEVYDFEEQYFYLAKDLIRVMTEGWTVEQIKEIYKDAEAITDFPGNAFFEELLEAYPDAKVIHLERSSTEEWANSLLNQLDSIRDNVKYRILSCITPSGNLLRKHVNAGFGLTVATPQNGIFFYPKVNRQLAILRYKQHNSRVKQVVPKDKLLLFKMSDGWEPLCKFLGKPVPEEAFPHKNKGASITDEIVNTSYIFDPIKKEFLFVLSAIFCVFGTLCYYYYS